MKTIRSLSAFLAVIAAVLLWVPVAGATNTTIGIGGTAANQAKVSWTHSMGTSSVSIYCPPMATTTNADTVTAILDVSRAINPYPGSSGVPTFTILGAVANADSVRVQFWWGSKPTVAADANNALLFTVSGAEWWSSTGGFGLTVNQLIGISGATKVPKIFNSTLYAGRYLAVRIVKNGSGAKSPILRLTFPHNYIVQGNTSF